MAISDIVKQLSKIAILCSVVSFANPILPKATADDKKAGETDEKKYSAEYKLEILGEKDELYVTKEKERKYRYVVEEDGTIRGFLAPSGHLMINNHNFFCKIPKDGVINDVYAVPVWFNLSDSFDSMPKHFWHSYKIGSIEEEDEIIDDTTPPKFCIPGKARVESSFFNMDNLNIHLDSLEFKLKYIIRRAGKTDVVFNSDWSVDARKHIMPLLESGENNLEIIVSDYLGNTSRDTLKIKIDSKEHEVGGIKFYLTGVAHENFEKDRELYEYLAEQIITHNRYAEPVNRVNEVKIVYFKVGRAMTSQDRPSGNAWFIHVGQQIVIGYGNFSLNDKKELKDIFTHEVGHKIYHNNAHLRVVMSGIYLGASDTFLKTFTDSQYCINSNAGHPEDNPDELFASAYMIFNNHRQRMLRKINWLDRGDKETAKKLIDLVSDVSQKNKKFY